MMDEFSQCCALYGAAKVSSRRCKVHTVRSEFRGRSKVSRVIIGDWCVMATLSHGRGASARNAAGIAAGLAEDGWDLALSYWHPYDERVGLAGAPDDPEGLADDSRGRGRRVVLVPGNLEDPAVPAQVVRTAAGRLGRLDALVMCHTESVDSGLLDTTVESSTATTR